MQRGWMETSLCEPRSSTQPHTNAFSTLFLTEGRKAPEDGSNVNLNILTMQMEDGERAVLIPVSTPHIPNRHQVRSTQYPRPLPSCWDSVQTGDQVILCEPGLIRDPEGGSGHTHILPHTHAHTHTHTGTHTHTHTHKRMRTCSD